MGSLARLAAERVLGDADNAITFPIRKALGLPRGQPRQFMQNGRLPPEDAAEGKVQCTSFNPKAFGIKSRDGGWAHSDGKVLTTHISIHMPTHTSLHKVLMIDRTPKPKPEAVEWQKIPEVRPVDDGVWEGAAADKLARYLDLGGDVDAARHGRACMSIQDV